jgi:hypothetical protein
MTFKISAVHFCKGSDPSLQIAEYLVQSKGSKVICYSERNGRSSQHAILRARTHARTHSFTRKWAVTQEILEQLNISHTVRSTPCPTARTMSFRYTGKWNENEMGSLHLGADRGSIPGQGMDFFLFVIASRRALGPTQPPTSWVPGALSKGFKRTGREADHLPPSSAEVNNARSYTSTLQICLHGVLLS